MPDQGVFGCANARTGTARVCAALVQQLAAVDEEELVLVLAQVTVLDAARRRDEPIEDGQQLPLHPEPSQLAC